VQREFALSKFSRISELADKGLDTINGLLLAIMVMAIFLQVIARYVFNHALSWPEELGRFLFAWIVFLAIVSVMRADEMLYLELLYRWIPKKMGQILKLIISLACFGFLLVILKGGFELMIRQSSQISIALEIPMWIVYMVIPTGTFLMAISLLIQIVSQIRELFAPGTNVEEELTS
jgi:TRAP-type C4-dicarboxylate transport system permease small subunit